MPVRLKDSSKVQRTKLQFASWLGNTTSLAIVSENDIFIRQSPASEEDVRVTNTGKADLIYNGVPDWLYQGKFRYAFQFLFRLARLARLARLPPDSLAFVHFAVAPVLDLAASPN